MLRRLTLSAAWLLILLVSTALAGDQEFRVRFSDTIRKEPYSGRVYLFFAKNNPKEPRASRDWFHPEPLLAIDVENWKPNEPLAIGASSGTRLLTNPKPLADLDLAGCRVQAVARFNPYERQVGTGS